MKLIKIKDDHYVVVTDELIEWRDYFLNTIQKEVYCHDIENYDVNKHYLKKITHSTIPKGMMLMEGIERLSLQEVKESFCWLDGTEWEVEWEICETYKLDECNSRFACCNKPKKLKLI